MGLGGQGIRNILSERGLTMRGDDEATFLHYGMRGGGPREPPGLGLTGERTGTE